MIKLEGKMVRSVVDETGFQSWKNSTKTYFTLVLQIIRIPTNANAFLTRFYTGMRFIVAYDRLNSGGGGGGGG